MSVLTSLGIVFVVIFIFVFLHFTPSVFLLFRHYACAKYSRKKTHDLDGYFMMGVELATVIMFVIALFFASFVESRGITYTLLFNWITAGFCVAFGIFAWFYYFKKGDGTSTFVSRKITHPLLTQVKRTKTKSDTFFLGFASIVGDLLLILPLLFICSLEIQRQCFNLVFVIGSVVAIFIASFLPILYFRICFRGGKNLADIQRKREQNKNFSRAVISLGFILIAIIIIGFRIIG